MTLSFWLKGYGNSFVIIYIHSCWCYLYPQFGWPWIKVNFLGTRSDLYFHRKSHYKYCTSIVRITYNLLTMIIYQNHEIDCYYDPISDPLSINLLLINFLSSLILINNIQMFLFLTCVIRSNKLYTWLSGKQFRFISIMYCKSGDWYYLNPKPLLFSQNRSNLTDKTIWKEASCLVSKTAVYWYF